MVVYHVALVVLCKLFYFVLFHFVLSSLQMNESQPFLAKPEGYGVGEIIIPPLSST